MYVALCAEWTETHLLLRSLSIQSTLSITSENIHNAFNNHLFNRQKIILKCPASQMLDAF